MNLHSPTSVGYQTKPVNAGFSLGTPSFTAIAGSEYNLADFKLSADAAGDGTEQIQVLDEGGMVSATYVWLNANVGMDDGWYDADTWETVDCSIKAGQGYLMYAEADVSITSAGEVAVNPAEVDIPAGFSVSGNSTPADINIQSMTLAEGSAGDGTEQIQILDEGGMVTATYVWLNANVGMDDGWYDADTWELIEAEIPAGQGLLMFAEAMTTMTIPSAL